MNLKETQKAVHSTDALKARDDFLAWVAASIVIDMGTIEPRLGGKRLLAQLRSPRRNATFDPEGLDDLLIQ